jgi:hypothetical protein
MQTSAEYVVDAVRHMRDHYHSKVEVLGWSAGRWWEPMTFELLGLISMANRSV